MRRKILKGAALAMLLVVATATIALADTISTDGDTVAGGNNVDATCTAKTVTSESTLKFTGGSHFADDQDLDIVVTPDSPITVSNVPSALNLTGWETNNEIRTFQFDTTVPANTPTGTYKVNVSVSGDKTDGNPLSAGDFFNVNVTCSVSPSNAAPVITAADFTAANVDCRNQATLSVTFEDTGSTSWTYSVDWDNDGTFDDVDVSTGLSAPGTFTATHTYNAPGTYTARVVVEDNQGLASNEMTDDITVNQTYTVTFLKPFDTSNPNLAIINKAKAGRTVPVKVQVYDDCALEFLDGSDDAPSIAFGEATGTNGATSDTVEVYTDAGASNSNDKYFRWSTDGFWIYNLNSKELNLVTGRTYRIDVKVGTVKATDDEWALLQNVK